MPLASVILPCYHSSSTLEQCLRGLQQQVFRDFEVIVVNSSQEDETARVAAGFPEVVFIQSPHRLYPHAARNLGVSRATGRLLVFSDPDCVADPQWLRYLAENWQQGRLALGGAMGLREGSWLARGIHLCKFPAHLTGQSPGFRWIVPTANAAYDRALWDRIGGFPNVFAGDAVQSWRARDAGAAPWFDPRAVVYHTHDQTLGQLLAQRFSRGKEFAAVRAGFENWAAHRSFITTLGAPLLPMLVLWRAAAEAARSGWFASFVATLPVQLLAHLAWSLGEARGCWNSRGHSTEVDPARG